MSDEKITVRITLAIGKSDHTWIEKTVIVDDFNDYYDANDDTVEQRAINYLLQQESEFLNLHAPSFITVIHTEALA